MPSSTFSTGETVPRVLVASFLVALVIVCGYFAINGRHIRAAAEAEEARIVDEENRVFCSKFGVGPGTSRYAECSGGLKEIRARYLQRSVDDSIL